jgi:recombination protein RecA
VLNLYLHRLKQIQLKTKDMSNADKLKALKLTMDKIDKDFGKGSVMLMGEKGVTEQEVISTGSIGLDVALGIGGLPKGRVVEIYGPESSGKTTTCDPRYCRSTEKGWDVRDSSMRNMLLTVLTP